MNKTVKIISSGSLKSLTFMCRAMALVMPASVEAVKKVYAPYVEKGEIELEYRLGFDIDEDVVVHGNKKLVY